MGERLSGRRWVRVIVTALLGGAAYAANRHSLPLSFGLHLLLGGMFSTLAAILYGPWAGAAAAALGHLPTVQLWGHPFALLSLTLEAYVVGFEARRGKAHHTETDLIYWLLVGGPLVMVTYTLGAHIPLMATGVAALKQAVNGLVYTAAASAMALALVWWQRGRRQIPLEILLANLFTFLVLAPLAFALSLTVRDNGQHLRNQLSGEAMRAGEVVRAGLVRELADQRLALQTLAAHPESALGEAGLLQGLEQVWLLNERGETVAQYLPGAPVSLPAMPEGEVGGVTTVTGPSGPMVVLREPVGAAPGALALAVVDTERLARRVLGMVDAFQMEVAVTDRQDVAVISSWYGSPPGTPIAAAAEDLSLFTVSDGEGLWMRLLTGLGAQSEETRLSRAERVAVVHRVELPDLGWHVFVRKPMGEVEYVLYRSYLSSFVIALALMVLLLVTIRLVAYTVTRPLVQLAAISVTPEGALANLPRNQPLWVTEVRAVSAHLEEVGARIKGLIQSLQETQRELQRHNVELAVANVHLADEALRDAQTGLHNQRAFWQQVQLWVEENHPFTLVLTGVQGLRSYADAHGHLQAEAYLKGLAGELQAHATLHGGEVYQYAAERFACLFPESSEWLVERMVLALPSVAAQEVTDRQPAPTLAVVGARFPEDGPTGPAVVKVADERLHAAARGTA